MRSWLLALLAAFAFLFPGAARADERILSFLSDVQVRKDGSIHVAETIRLRSEGNEIRRGILRDFPTRYKKDGRTVRVGFEVINVTRDGRPEPWNTESIDNGIRIRIGSADVLLEPGEYEYVIRYRTTRQLGFFKDYDELYWNATGTSWTFPLDKAEARIRLPAPAPFGNRATYTGAQGAKENYAEVVSEQPGEILFRTTAPLDAYEGLTVAVAWPKGVVDAPKPRSARSLWLQDNVPFGMGFFGLFGIFAYYFIAWKRAGRGPRAGTVVPLFSPPDDLSPPQTRYVAEMGSFDNRAFAAALVGLGVRHRIRLVEGEKGWFSAPHTTIEKTGDSNGLPAGEAALMNALFAGHDSILMDQKNHATFSGAKEALREKLAAEYDGKMFLHNYSWALLGLPLLFIAVWLTAASILATDPDLPGRSVGVRALFITLLLIGVAWGGLRWSKRGGTLVRVLGVLLATISGIVAALFAPNLVVIATANDQIIPLLIPLGSLPLIFSSFWWMAAPTKQGRALMDRIAGFRQYLSITEEERLQTMHPPENTPALFERYLPYAIALEVENEWADKFSALLAAAAAAGQAQTMSWYSGHSDPWNDVGGFTDRVGSTLASTVSSASTAPGSSSGSSGGGSSGGGGGGGGGSGW